MERTALTLVTERSESLKSDDDGDDFGNYHIPLCFHCVKAHIKTNLERDRTHLLTPIFGVLYERSK
jgi:hypothetical protein